MVQTLAKAEFSAVKTVLSRSTQPMTLGAVAKSILEGKLASEVGEIRQCVRRGDHEKAEKLKKQLPAFMPSGIFKTRKKSGLTQHSGFLCLDFDDCKTALKQTLIEDPYTVMCFVSPSGTGLKVIVRINADADTHKRSFEIASRYYRDKYCLECDKNCKDIPRLCYMSYDPELYFNEHVACNIDNTDNTDNSDNSGKAGSTHFASKDGDMSAKGLCNIEDIINYTQPSQPGQRHHKIFDLARGLKYECKLGNDYKALKQIVRTWYEKAKPNIATKEFTESWTDFVHAWERAEKGLSGSSLTDAWSKVEAGQYPETVETYDDERLKQLVALCYHLANSKDMFYLSMHSAGKYLKKNPNQISRWLKMLQADGVIELVKKGKRPKASTYLWKGSEELAAIK